MLEIEQIDLEKKCDFIKVDTLSFQALDFYRKHGFVKMSFFFFYLNTYDLLEKYYVNLIQLIYTVKVDYCYKI